MSRLSELLWGGAIDLSTQPLNARLYRSWNPACENVFGDILGAVPVSDATYLGGMFWQFHDPYGDGTGKGWALEPNDQSPDFFSFIPVNSNQLTGGGYVDVVVYIAENGLVVSYDQNIGPGERGAERPSPLHDMARVHRIGNANTVAVDPRMDPFFWEATEIGGRPSVPYNAVKMWLQGLLPWPSMPLRLALFNDTWQPNRYEIKYAESIFDVPSASVIGVSSQVPYENRHIFNGVAMYGQTGEAPGESFGMYAHPVNDVSPGHSVGGAVIYRDAPPYDILRICQFGLFGDGETSGTDPVWVGPVAMSIL